MTIIVQQDYWYIFQISGERLQDHWSFSDIGILHRFLVIVFNLKLHVFHVLQPSQFIIFSSFCSLLLFMHVTKIWINMPKL